MLGLRSEWPPVSRLRWHRTGASRLIRRVIPYRLLSVVLVLIAAAGCAVDTKSCTPVFGQVLPTTGYGNGGSGAQCPLGQVLVGYDSSVAGGPLLCAPFTVSCPIPK